MNIIVIVGPTASGKTALAIDIARRYNGEIICADSRTVYKELTIGTAKPSDSDRQTVKHHGLDLLYPSQKFSAFQFKNYCIKTVEQIQLAGKTPIIVGGSGLYIDAYLFDYQPPITDGEQLRSYETLTIEDLQKVITDKKLLMPKNYKNRLHLINTILRGDKQPTRASTIPENTIIIGIHPQRDVLKQRITTRVQQMISDGVVREAIQAFEKYGYDTPGLRGGIYKQLADYHKGLIDIDTVINRTITSDLQLAKRQITWFKRNTLIHWFDDVDEASAWMNQLLQGTL